MNAIRAAVRRAGAMLQPGQQLQTLKHFVTLATQFEQAGQYHQAIVYYRRALELARHLRIQGLQGQLMGNLGGAYLALGSYQQAKSYSSQALQIAQATNDKEGQTTALINLGYTCLYDGRNDESRKHFAHARTIAGGCEGTGRSSELQALSGMADVYNLTGQYAEAIRCLEEAESIAQESGDGVVVAFNKITRASIYSNLGDQVAAVGYAVQAVAIMSEAKHPRGYRLALLTLGNTLIDWGDGCDNHLKRRAIWPEAMRYFDRAISESMAQGDLAGHLAARVNRVVVLIRQRKPLEAIYDLATRAIPLVWVVRDQRLKAYCYLNLADAYTQIGEYVSQHVPRIGISFFEQAEARYRRALHYLLRTGDVEGQRTAYTRLGDLYATWLDDPKQAERSYMEARGFWNETRNQLLEAGYQINFFARGFEPFVNSIKLHVRNGQIDKALTIVEQVKSRTLLDLLASSRIFAPQAAYPGLRDLREQEESLITSIRRCADTIRSSGRLDRIAAAREMASLQTMWYELLERIELLAPEYVMLRRGMPLNFDAIRDCLAQE